MAYPTNPIYKLVKNMEGTVDSIKTIQNNVYYSIPFDPENTDYQEYLKWVEAGNTPEAAD